MESEERPTKLQKTSHTPETVDFSIAAPATMEGGLQADNLPPTEGIPSPKDQNEDNANGGEEGANGKGTAPELSKNQLKKQKRLERWEAGREDRKIKRKDKIKAKKERRREEWRQNEADEEGDVAEGAERPKSRRGPPPKGTDGIQVPITVIFDCDFEDLMYDNELKSLALQITRCYSDNRKAKYRTHLALSSFGGKLKERFDGILAKQYTSWKGFQFFSEDFVEVAKKSKEWMSGSEGGTIAGAISEGRDAAKDEEGEVVYLSSESDNILETLKPNSTYIIGGLVDKNRHKGVCYKRAMNRGIKTAKLPIGEFLHMKSRQVLVTNHVLEIMLKWMEIGDWGKAFMEVIPKRKGGVLKSELEETDDDNEIPGANDRPDMDSQMAEIDDNGEELISERSTSKRALDVGHSDVESATKKQRVDPDVHNNGIADADHAVAGHNEV